MQSYSLTVDKFLDHAAKWFGDGEVVTADEGEVTRRVRYAELRERSNQLSGALAALGMTRGDRIGTLAWNTQHHLEVFYASMGAGLVCHTLNPRVTATRLAEMVNEAENRILTVASSLIPLAADLTRLCPTLEHIVVMDEKPGDASALSAHGAAVWAYEDLIAELGAEATWGLMDETAAAGLCYTSGTTGDPKGVLYTHRSNYLHTLRALQADAMALTRRDAIMVAVPMAHANGWGLPFAGPAVGAKLVLPGRHLDGASMAKLMREERVTFGAGVYTVWLGVVEHLEKVGGELPDLERILIGGSKCPEGLIRRMESLLGAQIQTSWGMTELSPLGAVAPRDQPRAQAGASGRVPIGLDLKLTDADGALLPEQRNVVGRLKAKGASVVDRYFKAEADALDADGYFDTGDLACFNDAGEITICGRTKDLIKSGGEWINPAEIEEIVGRHSDVGQVAVIARVDAKWGERPVLIVEPQNTRVVDASALIELLRGQVADWWIPDEVVQIDAMPLSVTGKIDKRRLREEYEDGAFSVDGAKR